MYPAVVARGIDVVAHVGGLRVFAQHRVVVGAAGFRHGPQRTGVDLLGEQTRAHQPIRLRGGLTQRVLLD
ncbi:hypothetical protein D9M70_610090 [compost metagenome]